MKNREKEALDKEIRIGATTLSQEALTLMDNILESWRQLDELVQAEWKAVIRGDFSKLYRFARGKEILSEHIEGYEKRLRDIFFHMLSLDHRKESTGNVTALVLNQLDFRQRKRLMDFHVKRANHKLKVAFTNRRTMMWVRERMDFTNELVDILTGIKLKRSATYCPPGRSIVYRRSPGFAILNKASELQDHNEDDNISSHTRGMNAYSGIQARR